MRFADGVDALAEEELELKGQKLGRVTSFKYHTGVVLHDGFKPEVFSRIAQAT